MNAKNGITGKLRAKIPELGHRFLIRATIILLFILLSALIYGAAQAQPRFAPLSVGKKVPDVQINTLPEYGTASRISDLNGKLVLLDFWATWCTTCIYSFPKLDSLQKEYTDRLEIIRITSESEEKVLSFFQKQTEKGNKLYKLPTVAADTIFRALFPHQLVPHCVWIGPDGIVKAITTGEEVTAANVVKLLAAAPVALRTKKDLDTSRPLFMGINEIADNLLFYSVFSKGAYPGLGTGSILRRSGNVVHGKAMTNSTLFQLYQGVAIGLLSKRGISYTEKRMLLELPDEEALALKRIDGKASLYNFEFTVPVGKAEELYENMLENLNQYAGYNGQLERRKMPCLVLTCTGDTERIRAKEGRSANTLFATAKGELLNGTMRHLAIRLDDLPGLSMPVLDETNYGGRIDVRLSAFTSLENLQKELQDYGLSLEPAEREIELFILRKNLPASILPNSGEHPTLNPKP